jgi:hypothetical protein
MSPGRLSCHNAGVRRLGDRVLIGAGLVLVASAGVVLAEVFRLPPSERNDVFGLWGFALALIGAVFSVLGWLRRVRSLRDPRPVNTLADLLSQGVHGQWRKAAAERVLLTPAPIPVHWSLSSLPVTGDLTAALNGPFNPLPGLTAVTEVQLRAPIKEKRRQRTANPHFQPGTARPTGQIGD